MVRLNKKLLILIPIFIFFDQLSKQWALKNIFLSETIIKINSFLNLVPVWNEGISFGMFSGIENINFLITIITLVIICILFIWLFRSTNLLHHIALVFIISGAIGNLIDRFKHEAVIDFIDFHIKSFHWPAFNFADSYITIGACIYLFSIFTSEKLNNV